MDQTLNNLLPGGKGTTLINLIAGAPLMPPQEVPPTATSAPAGRRHLVDVLRVIPAGAGVQQVPRIKDQGLNAAVQSSEGALVGTNDTAELEACRQPFAQIIASVPASREVMSDSTLVTALLDGELREALRAKADTALAAQLAAYAGTFAPSSSAGLVEGLVAGVLAFGRRWGAARAIVLDHSQAAANVAQLIAAAPGVVTWQADGVLTVAGVPVILADLEAPGAAIITSGTVLQREAEAVVSLGEITTGVITLKATARLAAVGPALRVIL